MRNKRKVILVIILLFLVGVMFPYAKVELQTYRYGSEFTSLCKSNGFISEFKYLKVMNYSEEIAEVYYVTKNKTSGLLYRFVKDSDSAWQLEGWDAVWSEHGSADGFIWPYYR